MDTTKRPFPKLLLTDHSITKYITGLQAKAQQNIETNRGRMQPNAPFFFNLFVGSQILGHRPDILALIPTKNERKTVIYESTFHDFFQSKFETLKFARAPEVPFMRKFRN